MIEQRRSPLEEGYMCAYNHLPIFEASKCCDKCYNIRVI